jgi:ABC-type glycerol-3-phosphate transport system substrate-binding protein
MRTWKTLFGCAATALVAATPVIPSQASAWASQKAPSGSSTAPPVVLWNQSEPSNESSVIFNIVKAFNKSYPGGGDVSAFFFGNSDEYKTKLAVAMAAHNPPTIFYSWGGALLDQYIQAGNVANVSSALASDPAWKAQYKARNVWALASYKGGIYGIPATGPDFELMWQNKAALAKAGASPSPTSWTAFSGDLGKLKSKGITPITVAGSDLWPEMIWMQYLTLRYGGPQVFERINALTPGSWDNPAIIKAAEAVQQMAKAGDFETGFSAVTFSSGDADKLLAAGQAGFEAQLYFDEANMRLYDPSFAASPNYSPFNFPAVPGGSGNPGDLVGQPAEYYAVSGRASAAVQKEALAFLKYMTTSSTYNVNFLEDNGYTPVTANGATYLLEGKVPDGTLLHQLYEIGSNAPYLQPYWDQDLPSAVITPMLTDIGELFTLTITPQQFVTQLDKVLAAQPHS